MADKMRVHILAKELNVPSKTIVTKCLAEGLSVKNHMSTLSAGLEATIREWFSEGAHNTVVETSERIDLEKAHRAVKPRKRKTPAKKTEQDALPDESQVVEAVVAAQVGETATAVAEAPAAETAETASFTSTSVEVAPAPSAEPAVSVEPVSEPPADGGPPEDDQPPEQVSADQIAAEAPQPELELEPESEPAPVTPVGPQHVPMPAKLSGPRVVRYEAPEEYRIPKRGRRAGFTPPPSTPSVPSGPAAPASPDRPDRGGAKRKGEAARTDRAKTARRSTRSESDAGERLAEWQNKDLAERRQRLSGATGRRMASRRAVGKHRGQGRMPSQMAPITSAEVDEPVVLRQFCSAIGVPFQSLFPILSREHNLMVGINSVIPNNIAELVAAEFGVELKVVEAKTLLELLKEEFDAMERKNLQTRPPIVAVLGHVDHGKTSLLDAIRKSQVVDREDGGITQHISSCHFKRDDIAVTFLDTPGHEAFTALRARGAQITDVVVLVVAADDGIMPQTVEAINHAKAADVTIVVALNKIDLGTQNVTKIYGQLAEHGLTPGGDWGGDTDVIHTSATTGEGIDELLEHLSALAELHEYKADPTMKVSGTVVEAETRPGIGPVLQVIIREGTLRVSDMLVCGHAFGKVRAIRNDRGEPVKEAGPSMPAEIWGLNEVPSAGDHIYQVDSLQRAKDIADEIKQNRVSGARSMVRKARSLDDLVKHRTDADVAELNVIIRADVDGSIEALRYALGKFPSDEVKLNILHAGVGAVTDSDVHLATASDAIVVAFRVGIPSATKKLAETEGVDVRQYRVIYDLTDEIKKALEGLLAPDESLETRGSAEVRELFRITKLGLVAGCMVREGTMATKHLARVMRDSVLVRDGCKFESIRRFKENVKEVRSGFECGLRLEGFEDIKTGDVIEAYEIVKTARTLD